jgi:hypothetical protein
VPFYFINLWLIPDRHRYWTYLYYYSLPDNRACVNGYAGVHHTKCVNHEERFQKVESAQQLAAQQTCVLKPVKKEPVAEFVSAKSFAGSRRGYVFKAGPSGLGYYRDRENTSSIPQNMKETKSDEKLEDQALPKPVKKEPVAEFVSAKTFAGSRRGYVFKAGPSGLGYYRDRENTSSIPQNMKETKSDEKLEDQALPPGNFHFHPRWGWQCTGNVVPHACVEQVEAFYTKHIVVLNRIVQLTSAKTFDNGHILSKVFFLAIPDRQHTSALTFENFCQAHAIRRLGNRQRKTDSLSNIHAGD